MIIIINVVIIVLLLHAVTCDLPLQLLERLVIVDPGSQEVPHREGQIITYTISCPSGFVLNGSNTSVCTENGEWEPDPGGLACIGDNLCPIDHTII